MKNPFKQQLLQFNIQDPTINTKHAQNSVIDLVNFQQGELINWIWETTPEFEINIVDEPTIKKAFNNVKTQEEFKNTCKRFHSWPNEKQLSNWEDKKVSKSIIDEICNFHLSLKKRFVDIQAKSKQLQTDNNIYPLYVASYFLNGEDIHEQPINAPLLLWEVSLKITNDKITIIKNNNIPTVNQKLFFYLKNNYKTKIEECKTIEDFKKLPNMLSKVVDFSFDNYARLLPFLDQIDQKLKVHPSSVLTLVEPLGGCIKQDVENILEKEKGFPIKANEKIVDYHKYQQAVMDNDELIELQPLNLYQRFAITSSLVDNTLIYGPPGTGKSETIASLIANIIYRDKSILISSEKQAALDVLKERLGKLAPLCLYAFKPSHTEDLYNNLSIISAALGAPSGFDEKAFINNQKQINEHYQTLRKQLVKFNKLQSDFQKYNSIKDFFEVYQKIDKNEILKFDKGYFTIIKKSFDLTTTTLKDLYREIVILQDLVNNRLEAIKVLSKYDFTVTRQQVLDFLQHYESLQCPDWLLYNFINNKKNWQKEPTIKHKMKATVSIIKMLEDFSKTDLKSISFENLEQLTTFPHFIRSETDFNKYIAFSVIRDLLSANEYGDKTLDDFLQEYRIIKKKLTANTDAILFNRFIVNLKQAINKNKKLEQALNNLFALVNAPKRPPMNQLIKEHYDTLRVLFPIWVLSPTQTCVLNPLKKEIFDYGIFDEASQMFVENAIPLLYRVKIAIVAGDNKQLQPSAFFTKRNYDEEETDVENENTTSTIFGNSLFEQANINLWPKFHLKNHYRSQRFELIEFSSKNFYENGLEYNNKNTINPKPITLIEAKGSWKDQKNLAEVEEVLKLIPKFANQKLLIITFNQKQADELLKQFVSQFGQSKTFDAFLNGTIKIKSLENVQGDEADVVILSVSYGPDATKKVRQFFGPLSHQHGMNRLNVAITRAKQQLIVIKSLSSDDVVFSQKNASNNIFKDFLKFVETNANNPQYIIDKTPLSTFQQSLQQHLQERLKNYEIKTNVKIGKNILPVAIVNKNTKLVELAITSTPISVSNKIIEDIAMIDNQYFLQDLGYPTLLVPEAEYNQSPQSVVDKIIKNL